MNCTNGTCTSPLQSKAESILSLAYKWTTYEASNASLLAVAFDAFATNNNSDNAMVDNLLVMLRDYPCYSIHYALVDVLGVDNRSMELGGLLAGELCAAHHDVVDVYYLRQTFANTTALETMLTDHLVSFDNYSAFGNLSSPKDIVMLIDSLLTFENVSLLQDMLNQLGVPLTVADLTGNNSLSLVESALGLKIPIGNITADPTGWILGEFLSMTGLSTLVKDMSSGNLSWVDAVLMELGIPLTVNGTRGNVTLEEAILGGFICNGSFSARLTKVLPQSKSSKQAVMELESLICSMGMPPLAAEIEHDIRLIQNVVSK